MSNIKKVSFEITDSWDIEGFRNFIKYLLSEDTKYEVFIISNHDATADIIKVRNALGLSENNTIICNFSNDKVQAVIDNNIDIHLDNLQSFVLLVEETTDAYGVLVTPYLNKYELRPDYVIVFERILKILDEGENC